MFPLLSRSFLNDKFGLIERIASQFTSYIGNYISIDDRKTFRVESKKVIVECIDLLRIRPALYYPQPTLKWFEQGYALENDDYFEYIRKRGKDKQLVMYPIIATK